MALARRCRPGPERTHYWPTGPTSMPSCSRRGFAVTAITSNPGEVLASEGLSGKAPNGRPFFAQQLVQYRGTNRTILARGDADAGMGLMKRFHDGVYCAGGFRSVGGVPTGNLALWTGSSWTRVGNGSFQGLTAQATTLAVSGTNVYAAGAFEYPGE